MRAGTTFTLNLFEPFTEFWNSLTAAPSTTPIEPLPDVVQVLTHLAERVFVALDPFLPGGPYDPSDAGPLTDLAAAVNLPAEASTLLSGLDVSEPVNSEPRRRHGHNVAGPSGIIAGHYVLSRHLPADLGARPVTMWM